MPGSIARIDGWSIALLVGVVMASAVFAAILFAPARLLTDRIPGHAGQPASGTLWSGATLLRSGERMSWTLRPLASLMTGAGVAAVRVHSEDLDLAGEASISPKQQVVTNLNGWIDWTAVRRAAPSLTIECDATLRVTDASVIGGAALAVTGVAISEASTCALGTRRFHVPPTRLDAQTRNGQSIATVVAADTNALFATLRRDPNGGVTISITPAAQALTGSTPASGDIVVELAAP